LNESLNHTLTVLQNWNENKQVEESCVCVWDSPLKEMLSHYGEVEALRL